MTGTSPLLMHNARLADPLDPIVKQLKTISGKRIKTEADHEAMAQLEFAGGLYLDDHGPVVPGVNIERSLVEGARITKSGKKIERGLFVLDTQVPLIYKGPRTAAELYEQGFVSRLSVGVTTNRVMRTRPQFREWSLGAEAEVDEGVLNLSELSDIADTAGRMVGIGDYRPARGGGNGRYTTVVVVL
ncbi:MAG TPA: hypothetical protein VF317_06210 [Dermatophilaceae bacterium]